MAESKRARILRFLERQGENFVTADTIAARTGISLPWVHRVLDKLEEGGFAETIEPSSGSRAYRLADDSEPEPDTAAEARKRRARRIRGILMRYLELTDSEQPALRLLVTAARELDDLIELERHKADATGSRDEHKDEE